MKQNEEKHLMSIQFFPCLKPYTQPKFTHLNNVYMCLISVNSAMGEFAIYVTTRIPTLFKNNSNYGFQILFSI